MNDSVMHMLEQNLKHARAGLGEAEEALADALADAGRSASRYVRHNPWQVVAIAAGVGALIGWLAWKNHRGTP